jgi:hypothetical protein
MFSDGGNAAFKYAEQRPALLAKALMNVPRYGWTMDAITHAMESLHMPPTALGVVPRGAVEICEHLLKCKLEYVRDGLARLDDGEDRGQEYGREGVHAAKRRRLASALSLHAHFLMPWKDYWPGAAVLLVNPKNLWSSLPLLLEVVEGLHRTVILDTASCASASAAAETADTAPNIDPYLDQALLALLYLTTDLYVAGRGSDTLYPDAGTNTVTGTATGTDTGTSTGTGTGTDTGTGGDSVSSSRVCVDDELNTFIDGAVEVYMSVRAKVPSIARMR